MKFTILKTSPEVTTVRCEGPITFVEIIKNREALEKVLEQTPHRAYLLLNMERVTILDSAGISWMIQQHKRAAQNGGLAVFSTIPPVIKGMLTLLNMDQALSFVDEDAEGEKLLKNRQSGTENSEVVIR
jgi:anti-anti-sigma factor